MTDDSDPLEILDAIDRERGESFIGMIQANQVQRLRDEIVALRDELATMKDAYNGLADSIRPAVAESVRVTQARIYREGAEEMRELAAHMVRSILGSGSGTGEYIARAIEAALPLTPEERT